MPRHGGQDETSDFIAEDITKREPELELPQRNQSEPTPSAADISRYNPYGDALPIETQGTETGAMDNTTYFPGVNQPIARGQHSGPTVGSYTTYAANAYMPYGIIDNRAKAFEDAAMKKAKELQARTEKLYNPTRPDNIAQTEKYDKLYYDVVNKGIEQHKALSGNNWQETFFKDQELLRRLREVETAKLKDNEIFRLMTKAEMDIGGKGDKNWMSGEGMEKIREVRRGAQELGGGGDYSGAIAGLETTWNLANVINKEVDGMTGTISSYVQKNLGLSNEQYDVLQTVQKKGYEDKVIKELAKDIHWRYSGDTGYHSLEQTERLLRLKLAHEKKITNTNIVKDQVFIDKKKNENKEKDEYTENDIQYNQPINLTVQATNSGGNPIPGSTKDLKTNALGLTVIKGGSADGSIPGSSDIINMKTGERLNKSKIYEVSGHTIVVLPTHPPGTKNKVGVDMSGMPIETGDEERIARDFGGITYTPYVIANVKSNAGKTFTNPRTGEKKIIYDEQEVYIPIKKYVGPLEKKGLVADVYIKMGEEKTAESQKTLKPAKGGSTPSSSKGYNLNGHTYTKEELLGSGWTEEDINNLK